MAVLDTDGFVRAVRDGGSRDVPVLVAAGGFGGPAEHDRVGVLALRGPGPTVIVDAWLATRSIAPLVDALRSEGFAAREGGWDTMYATGYQHAWTSDRRGPVRGLVARGSLVHRR
ncbi:MAG: hypothetical protein HYV09_29720 [Deltaproteobacteria bacterium]|nr:hypothetical protein [Deltaproteobacteria bacterium]